MDMALAGRLMMLDSQLMAGGTVEPLARAVFLTLAFVLAGVLQTAWLRSPFSQHFATPLDFGRTCRGRRIFGDNKTLASVWPDVTEAGRLEAGDILVIRQTDPGWAPVFFVAGGLVMERGGMLSHGAIIAREYGIPTVVGVQDATRKIRSGQMLSVDGDMGCVRLVD